jgi:glucose/arabinose dehydrogenase
LALALGVFGAIATPGLAWADETKSKSGATSSASSTSDTRPPSKSSAKRDAGRDAGSASDADTDAEADSDPQDDAEDDSPAPEDSDESEPTDESEEPADSEDVAETDKTPDDAPQPADLGVSLSVDTDRPTSTEPVDEAPAPDDELPPSAPVASEAKTVKLLHTAAPAEASVAHEHGAAAPNLLADWGKQIGTALNLPTPEAVTEQIQAAVVSCLCGVVNGIQQLFGGMVSPATTPAPANPLQNAVMFTVLGWVRRQLDYAVAAFNRTPIGQAIHGVVQQTSESLTTWFDGVANSPLGREISASVGAFLQSCEDSTGLPAEFDRTVVVSGLTEPTDFELVMDEDHPDEVRLILITEKSGAIKSYDMQTGTLTTLIQVPVVTAAGERGLIGVEVDPNFWAVGQEGYHTVYAAYTGADNYDRLSSFTMSDSLTRLGSEQVLLQSTELANEFHHGGELEFDPTGQYLYWAVGNNTTPSENSQDLTNIHGKILRLNRDGTAAADNPFIEDENEITQRIYAYGFRNPFRFGFDPESGALLAGDVGEDSWEELNLVRAGANYGWPNAEGNCSGCGYIDPLYAYAHVPPVNSGSITSVLVYVDDSTPAGQRKVLISDYSLGWMRELTFDSEYSSLISERTFDSGAGAVVALEQAPNGDIYQLNIYPGTLSVIAPSGGNRSPSAVIDASATSGAGNSLEVEFSAAQSSDPDTNDDLTYQWDFGNGQTSTAVNPTVVFTNSAGFTPYTVRLTVSDGDKTNTTTQQIVVGSTPPTADFTVTSAGGYQYNAGDTIVFKAEGSDLQDGATLPDSAYRWTVEFHHAEHKHPFSDNVIGPDLSFRVPTDYDQLANTYYKVILTVTDRSGLTTTVIKDVRPNLVTLTFGANDPNAKYTVDGIPRTGLYTEDAVVGVVRTLGAVSPQTVNGQQLVFGSWSDGGAQTHTIVTPGSNTSYTVNYTTVSSSVAV